MRRFPVIWAGLLALVSLALGYVGYRSLTGIPMARSDAAFSSLQLFALEGSVPPQGTPLALNVARFMAPMTLAYATVLALMAILRDQFHRALVTLLARDHLVLIGLGHFTAQVAATLIRADHRVVVVEADSTNELIPGVRAEGAWLVIGDGAQPVILERARVSRARHVVIDTGDDAQNLAAAAQVRRAASEGSNRGLTMVHVAINDLTLWSELGRLQLARRDTGVTLEFYNLVDRAAQALLDRLELGEGTGVYRDLLIDGRGALAQRVIVHVVRRATLSNIRPRIHFLDESGSATLDSLLRCEPWIAESADLMELTENARSSTPVPTAIVCDTGTDATIIARAIALAKPHGRQAVYASVRDGQADEVLKCAGVDPKVHLVPTSEAAVSHAFLHQSGLELMARVRHDDYVMRERARGVTEAENPSLVGWEDLPESLKDSNRRFAQSIGEVIQDLGGSLVPLQSLEATQAFVDSGEILERLAIKEHERWMSDLREDGWSFGAGVKDPLRKTHPLLVEWQDLGEAEREKDRDAIRAIPGMLARVGFAIDLAPRDASPTPTSVPS